MLVSTESSIWGIPGTPLSLFKNIWQQDLRFIFILFPVYFQAEQENIL